MVTCTAAAVTFIRNQLHQRGKGLGLRVEVRPSPQSGLGMALSFCDQIGPRDTVIQCDTVALIVDQAHLPYLHGAVLDYHCQEALQGLVLRPVEPHPGNGCGAKRGG